MPSLDSNVNWFTVFGVSPNLLAYWYLALSKTILSNCATEKAKPSGLSSL